MNVLTSATSRSARHSVSFWVSPLSLVLFQSFLFLVPASSDLHASHLCSPRTWRSTIQYCCRFFFLSWLCACMLSNSNDEKHLVSEGTFHYPQSHLTETKCGTAHNNKTHKHNIKIHWNALKIEVAVKAERFIRGAGQVRKDELWIWMKIDWQM